MSAHGTLMGVFLRFAASEAMALRTERAGDLSYKALSRACTALAARLSELDGEDRSPVLIYGHRDPRYIVGYWACLLTGRAVVPVEPDLSASRIAEIARMTGARRILLGETPTPDALTPDCARMVVRVDLQAHGELFLTPDVSDDDVAYILFSSGTTGKPKGIAVTYANLADFAQWCRELSAEQGGAEPSQGMSAIALTCHYSRCGCPGTPACLWSHWITVIFGTLGIMSKGWPAPAWTPGYRHRPWPRISVSTPGSAPSICQI